MINKSILDKKNITMDELKEILASKDLRKVYTCYFVKITPSDAKFLIENHVRHNRDLKRTKVNEYRIDMENGDFNQKQGDSISFDIDGKFTDGHHRMNALAEVDETKVDYILFCVSTSAERSQTKDTGVKRSTFDNLKYTREDIPEKYEKKMNSVINALFRMYGDKTNKTKKEKEYFNYFFDNHISLMMDFLEPMNLSINGKNTSKRITEITNMRAYTIASLFNLYALKEINDADLKYIVEMLINGIAKESEDVTLIKLRDVLTATKWRGEGDDTLLFITIDKYVKAWKEGKSLTRKLSIKVENNKGEKVYPDCFNFGGQLTKYVLK